MTKEEKTIHLEGVEDKFLKMVGSIEMLRYLRGHLERDVKKALGVVEDEMHVVCNRTIGFLEQLEDQAADLRREIARLKRANEETK